MSDKHTKFYHVGWWMGLITPASENRLALELTLMVGDSSKMSFAPSFQPVGKASQNDSVRQTFFFACYLPAQLQRVDFQDYEKVKSGCYADSGNHRKAHTKLTHSMGQYGNLIPENDQHPQNCSFWGLKSWHPLQASRWFAHQPGFHTSASSWKGQSQRVPAMVMDAMGLWGLLLLLLLFQIWLACLF